MWRRASRQATPATASLRPLASTSQVPRTTATPFPMTAQTGVSHRTTSSPRRAMAGRRAGTQAGAECTPALCGTPSRITPPSVRTGRGGGLGTAGDFDEPMVDTYTPGSPAYLEGHRTEALSHARKNVLPPGRDATKPPGSGGRFGGQQASSETAWWLTSAACPPATEGAAPAGTRLAPAGRAATGRAGATAAAAPAMAAMAAARAAAAPGIDGARRDPSHGGVAGP